jgi:hypothetical protein
MLAPAFLLAPALVTCRACVYACGCAALLANGMTVAALAEDAIHFDLPATAAAVDVTPCESLGAERLVSIEFRLSLIADSLPSPKVEQVVVQICPMGGEAMVADYAPRTELASKYAGNIEVTESKEVTDHYGASIDGAYGHLVRGNIGADRGEKSLNATKFNRVAPMHVVAASGTTHRGRGVYFKLRADDQQVLEGDKRFTIVLRVPEHWRGELIDFRVEAESVIKSFSSSLTSLAGIPPKSQVIGRSRFIVATHCNDDVEMTAAALRLAEYESSMRSTADEMLKNKSRSFASTKHVSFRLDLSSPSPIQQTDRVAQTIHRVIFGHVDPYIDPAVRELPLDTRVSILDYLEARESYHTAARSKPKS